MAILLTELDGETHVIGEAGNTTACGKPVEYGARWTEAAGTVDCPECADLYGLEATKKPKAKGKKA